MFSMLGLSSRVNSRLEIVADDYGSPAFPDGDQWTIMLAELVIVPPWKRRDLVAI